MPKKLKGTVEWAGDHWKARVRLRDKTRPCVHLAPGLTREQAEAQAMALALRARNHGGEKVPDGEIVQPAGETVAAWCVRWCAARRAAGNTSVIDDESRLRCHVEPLIGDLPIASVTTAQIEAIVDDLDAKVRASKLSWRTARLVWGLVTKMFGDAKSGKPASLRARKDNPAFDVRGPDRGDDKSKVYLYPSEFLKLVRCEGISLRWRRIYALSVYLYSRAGELEALSWDDVDLAHGVVQIHRAVDRGAVGDEAEKATKTGKARRFALEPRLLPLLRAMHASAGGRGRLVDMPPVEDLAVELRKHMERAGIDRAELFINDRTRKWMTFHDLRATGITWMAVRGDDPLRIQQRAGHEGFATTQGYIREAEAVRGGFGEVFPPLPREMWAGDDIPETPRAPQVDWTVNGPDLGSSSVKIRSHTGFSSVTPTGFEPVLPT